jgi:hypothetical protein
VKVSFLTQSGHWYDGTGGILIRPRLRLLPTIREATGTLKLFVIEDPDIDPLDAVRASVGYVNQTLKDRRIITPQIAEHIFKDMLLGHLANTPQHNWTDFMWQCIREQSEGSKGKFFLKHLGDAMVNGKDHWLNHYKFFILRNWHVLRPTTVQKAGLEQKFPGLKNWHPDAAAWLMMKVRVRASGCTAKLFTNERERCLLPGKRSYRVTLKKGHPRLSPS